MNPEIEIDEPAVQPDVETDRSAPVKEPGKDPARREPSQPPLEIDEIEKIEDDAPGG